MEREKVHGALGAESDDNSVRIADDVVGVIAGIAAMEVEGVAGMAGGLASNMAEMLGKRSHAKGVRVQVGEKECAIDIFVVVEYGVRIPDVAQKVQEHVKQAVESMTGLNVVEVNIHVQGVSFHTDNRAEELRLR